MSVFLRHANSQARSKMKILSSRLSAPCKVGYRSFSASESPEKDVRPKGFMDRLFGLESNVAPESFRNRWLMVVPAFATHMCIGAPYAWSLMGDVITREVGFVASVAADWPLMQAALPLSIVIMFQGIGATVFGKWQLKVGPRKSLACASVAFGGGLAVGALGISMHCLPLLYAGYGVMAGSGLGLAYTPPVQALMQWFPDKKGIASGLTIAGFGSGALLFAPVAQMLMKKFAKMPEYLGPASDFATKVVDGRLMLEMDGALREVVNATASDLAKVPFDLAEGLYLVGTGSTGAAEALAVIGAGYFGVILASALAIKRPHPSFVPDSMLAAAAAAAAENADNKVVAKTPDVVTDVTVDEATRTPQFHLLGGVLVCIATGGLGMFSVAKPLMNEVFSSLLPAVVTSAFASQFLLMLSAGNLGGRLAWSALSDYIGRRNVVNIFVFSSIPIYFSVPYLVDAVGQTGSVLPLYGFCAVTTLAMSMMGGTYSLLPAYEADIFGTKYVGPIHGRMLLYSSAAALIGPYLLIQLRSISEMNAIKDLAAKVDPEVFLANFGSGLDRMTELVASKTVTINKLLVLCPQGTIDPTPHIYDSSMQALTGVMALAALSHYLVRPLPPRTKVVDLTADAVSVTASDSAKTGEESTGDRRLPLTQ